MDANDDLVPHWPLFGLRIETPRLVLRVGRDSDYGAAIALVDAGIHDPAVMPFQVPWTDGAGELRAQRCLQYWWSTRSNFKPDNWNLDFFVFANDQLIGTQGMIAADFATMREVGTGSWLGRAHQGHGYGIEMRAAVLQFGFEHLGATAMVSSAFLDNVASIRVSRKLGYEDNGIEVKAPRGEPRPSQRFRLTCERWTETRRSLDVRVTGLEPCRALLGL